jgi:exonuclease VII small subunit
LYFFLSISTLPPHTHTHTNTNAHTNTSTYTLIASHPCTHSYAHLGSLSSITEELARTRERAEKAEKLIFDLNHSVTDGEHCMYDSNMERTIPYEQAILALKENIQRLDSERVRLQETLDLRDSAMMLLTADLDSTLDSMKGGYEFVFTGYEFYFCSSRISWICFFTFWFVFSSFCFCSTNCDHLFTYSSCSV